MINNDFYYCGSNQRFDSIGSKRLSFVLNDHKKIASVLFETRTWVYTDTFYLIAQ